MRCYMSVGSVGKWFAMSVLVAAAAMGATGCKDDGGDDTDVKDGGKADSGGGTTGGAGDGGGGGGSDAGAKSDGGGDAAVANSCPNSPGMNNACCMIGTESKLCEFHTTGLGPTPAGCALSELDAAVCGISSMNVLGGKDPKFIEKNAPGKPSPSCAAFYDKLETVPDGGVDAGLAGNGLIDTKRSLGGFDIALQYPGCCTAAGFCSIDGMMGMSSIGMGYSPANTGYGCMHSAFAFAAYAGVKAAGYADLSMVPCDPATGMIKPPPAAGDGGTSDGGASDAGVAADTGASDASADAAGG